jgi:hypothetical protein
LSFVIDTTSIDVAERRPNMIIATAGALQLAALLTPAVHVPLARPILFLRLPNAGIALAVLAIFTIAIAFRVRGWWRWLPGLLSALLLIVAYWRIARTPSGTVADVVLRHTVHPAWGFVPMGISILIGLVGAAFVRSAPLEPRHDIAVEIG